MPRTEPDAADDDDSEATAGDSEATAGDSDAAAGDSDAAAGDGASPRGSVRQGIQSVEIAMVVLRALEDGGGPMSLTQVGLRSGMAPSKAHRYLVSLVRSGLAAQSPTSGLYNLGPALRRMGAEALRRMDEAGLASELLPGLRDRTQHAVNLSVWGDNGPVIVRWEYGSHALPLTVRVGATLPLLDSSAGKVFLAYLPDALTARVVRAERSRHHEPALPDGAVRRLQEETRAAGYATTSGSVLPGIATVSAPVFTAGDPLPLVVTVALPTSQATKAAVRSATARLLAATQAMSRDLGHVPGPSHGAATTARRSRRTGADEA